MKLASASCRRGATALNDEDCAALLAQLPDWQVVNGKLTRRFKLADFHATMDFANAIAAMVHQQDHHPEMALSYQYCTLAWNTHSAGGQLSENDFICAARCDALFAARAPA